MFEGLRTQHVLQWDKKIKEFLPWLHYFEGTKNILTSNLSQLLPLPTPSQFAEGKTLVEPVVDPKDDDELFSLMQKLWLSQ